MTEKPCKSSAFGLAAVLGFDVEFFARADFGEGFLLIFAFLAAGLAAMALGFDTAGFFVVAVGFGLEEGFALVLSLLRALALVLAAFGLAAGFALVLTPLRALALVLKIS